MNTTIFQNIVNAFDRDTITSALKDMGANWVKEIEPCQHIGFIKSLIRIAEQTDDLSAQPGKPEKQKPGPAMAADNSMEKPIRLMESDLETQLAKLQDSRNRQNTILNDLLRGVSDIAVLQDRVNETREQINKLYQKWPQTLRPDAYRNVGNYSESGTEYQDV